MMKKSEGEKKKTNVIIINNNNNRNEYRILIIIIELCEFYSPMIVKRSKNVTYLTIRIAFCHYH